jgi:hypothetical protein
VQQTWEDAVLAQDEPIEHSLQRSELEQMVDALLSRIPEKHQKALRLCYGLDGGLPLKQAEVCCCCSHSCRPCNLCSRMASIQNDSA